MVMGMFMDWFRRRNRCSGSGDDSLVIRSHGDVYRFARDGDAVAVWYGDDSYVLVEPGLGGMIRAVMPWVVVNDAHRLPRGWRLKYFLDDVVVPFSRWSGLSAFRHGDAGADCNRFKVMAWRRCSRGADACERRLTRCFHFKIPAIKDNPLIDFFTVGVLLTERTDGAGHAAYLVMDSNYVKDDDWDGLCDGDHDDNRIAIGPFAIDDLVHELRALCDFGWVEPSTNVGLVVELAELEASRRIGVPRNVTMEDIIDGYPGADDY